MTYRRRLACLLLLLPGGCGGDTTGNGTGSVQPGSQCPSDGAEVEAGDGCNTCTCSKGTWVCTDMACGQPCTEGDATDAGDGCNSCSCAGGEWVCTNRACPPPAECTEGDTRPADDGCNTCTCAGGLWGCTKRACQGTGVGCGARLGDTCSATEYCAYEEGQYCGAADASSVCKPRPTVCTDIYAPVCGCDGRTYSSDCYAAGAGTGVLHGGDCAPQL